MTAPTLRRGEVIRAYAKVARPIAMRAFAHPRTCIASTWITIETLKAFSVKAEPLAVRVIIRNRPLLECWRAYRAEHGDAAFPPVDLQLQWKEQRGAHELAVGYGSDNPEERGIDGHLVAWIPSRSTLVDASFDQFTRAAKGIGPFDGVEILRIPRSFLRGEPGIFNGAQGEAGMIDRHPRLALAEWEGAPDWRLAEDRWRHVVDETVRAVQLALTMAD